MPAALRSLPAAMYPVDRTGLGVVILACQTFSYVGWSLSCIHKELLVYQVCAAFR